MVRATSLNRGDIRCRPPQLSSRRCAKAICDRAGSLSLGGSVTSCGKSVRCWDVNPNASLDAILTWCLQVRRVNRLLLTSHRLVPEVEDLVAQLFKNHLLRSVYATEWPAVQLVGHAGRVFVVQFDEDVKEIMVATENALSCWVFAHRPPLPEDICVYREGDPYPALVSVTHEEDAWLLHEGEIDDTLASPALVRFPLSEIPPPPDFISMAPA